MVLDLTFLESTETLIPFLFTLATTFGVLEITRIFNKPVNFLIALALSFFAITNSFFISLLWSQFGNITMFFIIMFFIVFILEAFGIRKKGPSSDTIVINSAILFLLLSVGFLYVENIPSLPYIGGGENFLLLVAIVIILVIFWSAYKVGSTVQPAPQQG